MSDRGEPSQEAAQTPPPAPARLPRRQRRGWRRAVRLAEIAFLILLLPLLVGIIAVLLATDNSLRLPQPVETRIAALLDGAVESHEIEVNEIGIGLPDGRFTPEILLSGVEIRENGTLRAYLPEVSVVVSGAALLRGEFRPRRVRLDDAGLRFSRDASGVIDFAVSLGPTDETVGITETLARMDAMFAEPTFAELEEISGRNLVLLLADEITGQVIQSLDAEMVLEQKGEALTMRMGGSVAASRDSRISLAVTRNPGVGRNDILLAFEELAARDLATASPALAWLDLMRAPITGRLVGQVSDVGRIGDVRGEMEIGPGQFRPRDEIDPIPIERVAATIAFAADDGRLDFEELAVVSEQLSFNARGQADITENGRVMVGQLRLADLVAAPEALFEAPLRFEGGAADLRLSLLDGLDLQIGQAVLHDGPLRIQAWGQVRDTGAGLETRIDARIPALGATDLFPYWPAFLVEATRDWVTGNLLAGDITGFAASWRRQAGAEPQLGIRFDFAGLELSPIDDMPPITQGAGFVSVINQRFSLALTSGQVVAPDGGVLDVAGSSMVIPDLRPRNPAARFDLQVAGPIPSLGSLLALPPVNMLAESELDPGALATGRFEGAARLDLVFRRVIPRDEIRYGVAGRLLDVEAAALVPGRVLQADALDLTATPEVVAIAGRARLDGIALTGRWSQALGPDARTAGPDGTGPPGSRAEGRVTLSPQSLARFGIALPQGLLSGSGGADFALDLPRGGAPELRLSSDLAGIGLAPPGVPWSLPRAATADFAARITLGPTPSVPELTVSGRGVDFAAAVELGSDGAFQRLRIDRARIGGVGEISGALTPGRLRISGGTLDLRGLAGGGSGGGGLAVEARLDRLTLADGIALTGLSADLGAGLSGAFQGQVNGGATIRGDLSRNGNGLAIDIQAPDAGAVLRSAGVFQNGYGGALALSLQPTGGTGSYDGVLAIDGARLRNAPAMAELLNAISVVGLLEQLGGEGINLGDLDARFRIRPGAIVLDEGTAVGPSMGISMDGVYNTATGRYDMQGVISPLYIVNGLAGAIFAPRREGLFGFTFRLEGTPEGSQVNVNPLSILTPGIFREIFRRPPPELVDP